MPAEAHSVFELPGGLVMDGRPMVRAELRPLTGHEEDWLAHHHGQPSAVVVTRLLAHCLVRVGDLEAGPDLPGKLLVGDRDFLMLQLRRLTLGDRFQAVLVCPACGAKADVDFTTGDVPVERHPQTSARLMLEFGKPHARCVQFRLPSGADQEAVLGMPVDEAAEALLDRCVLDDGGHSLSAREREAVIEEMERLAPKVELELDVKCPECGHAFLVPFDTTLFFFREMRLSGRQLLGEVHLLALYYHWSEDQILGLQRSRRRAYLELLGDALRRD